MGNSNDFSVQQTEGKQAQLAIIKSIVQKRDRLSAENIFDLNKIDPVALDIRQPFRFVPFKSRCSVVTNRSYVKPRTNERSVSRLRTSSPGSS
jgi:hypothetical protein